MEPFVSLNAKLAPLNRVNVDTDQIIPKQFLKRVERTGFGQFLFCLLYTSPSPRDRTRSRMPSSA